MSRNNMGRMAGEFLVIVVGVLTALAVDQSRSWRGERVQERLYLEGLAQDLARGEEDLQRNMAHYVGASKSGRTVLPVLQGLEGFPDDTVAFLLALYDPARSIEPVIPRATYADVVSTGSLRLFRDDPLRRRIVDYYESIASVVSPTDYSVDRAPYRRAIRSLIPLDVQTAIRSCGPPRDEIETRLRSCRDAFLEVPLGHAVAAILARDELASELTFSLQSAATGRFEAAEERTMDLRLSIERELDGS